VLGVVCFEGQWSTDIRDQQTVQPVLELLQRSGWIRFLHRFVASETQLKTELRQWAQKKNRSYELCYVACHGEPGVVHLGNGESVTAETIADWLAGRLQGRMVYFGACSVAKNTRDVSDALASFKRETKARAVCAYTEDIDWIESAAFEILLLKTVGWYDRRGIAWAFRYLDDMYGPMVRRLGFTSVPKAARARN
jgi:hypothetical protein